MKPARHSVCLQPRAGVPRRSSSIKCTSGPARRRDTTYLIKEQPRSVVAHASQHFHHRAQEANVKHGLGQLDVAKVTWRVLNITTVRRANDAAVHRSKPGIAESIELWTSIVISLTDFDLHHGVLPLQHPAHWCAAIGPFTLTREHKLRYTIQPHSDEH